MVSVAASVDEGSGAAKQTDAGVRGGLERWLRPREAEQSLALELSQLRDRLQRSASAASRLETSCVVQTMQSGLLVRQVGTAGRKSGSSRAGQTGDRVREDGRARDGIWRLLVVDELSGSRREGRTASVEEGKIKARCLGTINGSCRLVNEDKHHYDWRCRVYHPPMGGNEG